MKKRHIGKVNILPRKEKDMLKFLNDPKAFQKLAKLGKIADSMSNTQKLLSERKYDSIEEWLAFSLSIMSPSLLAETEKNGFQDRLQQLVIDYTSLGETENA